jgi:hypothetical protein
VNNVYVPWNKVQENDLEWNEISSKIVEKFGFSGDRYTVHIDENWLVFNFKNEKDTLLCKIFLSEHIENRISWTSIVDEHGILTLPEDLIKQVEWKENDTIEWINNGDDSFTLKKKNV